MKSVKLKFLIILLFLLSNYSGNAQDESNLYSKLSHYYGYIVFVDNAFGNQAINKRHAITKNAKTNFVRNKKLFFTISIARSDAVLNEEIEIKRNIFHKGDLLRITANNVCLGYEIKKIKNIDIGIYSGLLFNEYNLKKNGTGKRVYYTKFGAPLGFDLNWRKELGKEKKGKCILVYFNNSINYSGLKKTHERFNNFYYAYELGLGWTYVFKPSKSKKKKRKSKRKRR